MLKRRVEVLFDPERFALLEELARVRNTSVGALVREAVERELLGPTQEEKRAALERFVSQNIDFGTWEEMKEAIHKEVLKDLETT